MLRLRSLITSLKDFGPGALVTAAFIGPGTLTTCTMAGASWGYALLWGMLFSVIATIILQEMAARLGIVGRKGLGEAVRLSFGKTWRVVAVIIVVVAIGSGNAAYQAGNIAGASLGLESVTTALTISLGNTTIKIWPAIGGLMAFLILFSGSYRLIEKVLVSLVIIMSITFVTTAVMVKPPVGEILKGIIIPSVPAGSVVMLIGLIGTTVVPYNLFLHASAAREKWKDKGGLASSKIDSIIAIGAGGIISGAIIVTSAAAYHGSEREITGVADLGAQLEPLLGPAAKYFMAAGIFSAGLSSAITAPVAASYAITGVLGIDGSMKGKWFRLIWMTVLLTGVVFAMLGMRPVRMIILAQFANGLLLPVLALFLLKVMNNREILGNSVNGLWRNIAGIAIILITLLLGLKSVAGVTGLI